MLGQPGWVFEAAPGSAPDRGERLSRRFLLLALAVWLTAAAPLLDLGHGSDTDAWLVARTAEHLWTDHVYVPSRSSGFPLFEMGVSPLVHSGRYWVANLFALAAASALLASLVELGRHGHLRHPRILLLLVAFLPPFLKNATSTMDYLPALALLSWSYVATTNRRFGLAVVLIGISAGFRPTGLLYLLPTLLYFWLARRSLRRVVGLGALGGAIGVAAYAPVLIQSGLRSGFKDMGMTAGVQILMAGYNSLQVFGVAQTIVVAIIVALALRRRPEAFQRHPMLGFHVVVIGVWSVLFLAMPHEPEYLFPAALSALLLLDRALDRRAMLLVAGVMLSYHAVRLEPLGGKSGHRALALSVRPGYTYRDVQAREFLLSTRAAATRSRFDRPTVLAFGADWTPTNNPAWETVEPRQVFRQKDGNLYIADATDADHLHRFVEQGFRVVAWEGGMGELARICACDEVLRTRVEIIPSLDDFLGQPTAGAALYSSR